MTLELFFISIQFTLICICVGYLFIHLFSIAVNFSYVKRYPLSKQLSLIATLLSPIALLLYIFKGISFYFFIILIVILVSQIASYKEQKKTIKQSIWLGLNTWYDDKGKKHIETYDKKKKIVLILFVFINICAWGIVLLSHFQTAFFPY